MRGHGGARMVVGSGRGAGGAGRGQDGAAMPASVASVISRFLEEYMSSTPQRLKLLDAYLLYILLTGALQFGYCLLVGTFPFNSFLSGFISCVGSFILAGFHFMVSRDRNAISLRTSRFAYCRHHFILKFEVGNAGKILCHSSSEVLCNEHLTP
ncbi:dolichyl-diphosphooligosaccharide--protein glycosyltransferase subunit DAD1 isoform X1 [Notamacropus eugenii]|uniref:dolichyl-diphosphooligosaccharide--protein glycosyltransferase subunit DAD1 isoform X1 n=1 Tax=Notamacropus eugenii TaxID=9315 RepID=UPI003B677A19